ncbi:hypothetical protein HFO86_25730 [Rhizobium leguminosarum]|uniref:McrB family protein n=1 Tax=Rhizobium leguminosarum TaxID=384 RepID=UPI001C94BA56|nr:hypothetical protein [Rhizobium leguminosarum]MBY5473596.1 hypothetical protein [Rhizobium leguminosarum]
MGVLYPGEGVSRLTRVGRLLKTASQPDGFRRIIATEVATMLVRYQFDNPIEQSLPPGCDVHPYYAVLRAASELDGRIHWDELNRELMRITTDSELAEVIARIKHARLDPHYKDFIGSPSNDAGLLRSRTHSTDASAPEGKSPVGQLRDQRMSPFLKRAGFGELLLASAGVGGGGYWAIPGELKDIVEAAVSSPPPSKTFTSEQEWIDWFCEGELASQVSISKPTPIKPAIPLRQLTLADIKAALAKYEPDLQFDDEILASIVAAMRAGDGRNFIILKGVSGTGKSKLVAAIAKALYSSDSVDAPYLTIVEVRPEWTDRTGLMGHYDPISSRYIRKPFLDAILEADTAKESPFLICLDEMNLARVEYYLADCLSAMESGNPIHLDNRKDASVPSRVSWPANVYLFGTVNVDETTLRLSDKVLDRAQVIDTSDIDFAAQLEVWLAKTGSLTVQHKELVRTVVTTIWGALKQIDSHFGFRTGRAIVRFIDEANQSTGGVLPVDDALDLQVLQKILVKLRGEGDRWEPSLAQIERALVGLGSKRRSYAVVQRMRDDLERIGSFQFWH